MIKYLNTRLNFAEAKSIAQPILFAFIFSVIGCQEVEPTVVLEVSVIDKLSELRDSVKVSIYSDSSSWEGEMNPFRAVQYTNKKGKVRFFGLPAGKYFLDTQLNDSLSNLEGKTEIQVKTEGSFSLQQITLIVDKNTSDILSNPGGKTWRTTRIELFGIDYTNSLACLLDNKLVFHKGNRSGKYEYLVGKDLCSAESAKTGSWTLDESGTELIIKNDKGTSNIKILSISSGTMILQQTFEFNIFKYNVYYEVVK